MAKTIKSVMEVTVMATPAFFMVSPTFSSVLSFAPTSRNVSLESRDNLIAEHLLVVIMPVVFVLEAVPVTVYMLLLVS